MKTIVVPTDFSPIANNASQYAISMANILGCNLIFIHADEHNESESKHKLKNELYAMTGSNFHAKVNFISTDKLFNSETIKEVIKEKIDLITIGTSPESTDFSKHIFGTNTFELIENIRCPVLAIPEHYIFSSLRNIGYGTDLNTLNDEIVKVIEFARPFGALIKVFHVSPVFPDLGDVEKMDVKSSIETLKQRHDYPGIEYFIEKTSNDNQVHKGINKFLSYRDLDILVLFHTTKEGFDRYIISSESEDMIKEIKLPLLIFPKING